jgi:outer membrane protein assembly factor BamB
MNPRRIMIGLSVLLFSAAAWAQEWSFIHMSDTHFGAGTNDAINVQMFKEISAIEPLPKFAINTGDVVEIGTDEEFATYREAIQHLEPTMYVAPGNHDVRWNPRGKEGYTKGTDTPLYQAWDHGGIHFVTLDSTVLLQHWGHISADQLSWLKQELETIGPEKPVVIGFHHWIGRERVMVDNEQELIDLVEPYNVVLWLQGHGHSDIEWSINGAPAIMQKGLYQGSYSIITVKDNALHIQRRSIPAKKDLLKAEGQEGPPAEYQLKDVMVVPLKERPRAEFNADAKHENDRIIVRVSGHLADDSRIHYRINGGEYREMAGGRHQWQAELPTEGLVAGEHLITVQVSAPDGRAYQKPVPITLPGNIAPVWETNIGGAVQSRLVRHEDLLLIPSMGGALVALDARTGEEKWRVNTENNEPVYATPHVDRNTVYFGSADHHVYAVNVKNGDVKWRTKTGGAVLGGPSTAKGIVAIGSVDTYIYGFDRKTGEIKWRVGGENMYQAKAATDGENFFLGGWDNTFRCIEATSGTQRWALRLGKRQRNWTFSAFSPAITSPDVGNGKVFVSTNDGILHGIDIPLANQVWHIDWERMGYSSPLFREGRIYAALDDKGRVFCVNADNGQFIWQADTGSVIYDSSFAYGGGNVFIGCVDGTFNALSADTGEMQWQYRLGVGHVLASPAADDEMVYISSLSGKVTALPVRVARKLLSGE